MKTYEIKSEEIMELARLNSLTGYKKAIEDVKKFNSLWLDKCKEEEKDKGFQDFKKYNRGSIVALNLLLAHLKSSHKNYTNKEKK